MCNTLPLKLSQSLMLVYNDKLYVFVHAGVCSVHAHVYSYLLCVCVHAHHVHMNYINLCLEMCNV